MVAPVTLPSDRNTSVISPGDRATRAAPASSELLPRKC